jgi:hypothetical protein
MFPYLGEAAFHKNGYALMLAAFDDFLYPFAPGLLLFSAGAGLRS